MFWTLARYQVTSSCECSYVIYGACSIYLLDLFLFPYMWAWYHLLSLDGRTPCLLPSSLPHHCCFLYICPDMKNHCSTARRWPDNVGLARGRRPTTALVFVVSMISIPIGLLGGELKNLMRLTTCHLPATNLFATLEVYHEWSWSGINALGSLGI
jgi:hypothetical protein